MGREGVQHEIKLTYLGGGKVAVQAGSDAPEELELDTLDRAAIERIASSW